MGGDQLAPKSFLRNWEIVRTPCTPSLSNIAESEPHAGGTSPKVGEFQNAVDLARYHLLVDQWQQSLSTTSVKQQFAMEDLES